MTPDELITMILSKQAYGPNKNEFSFHSSRFMGFVTKDEGDVLAKEQAGK